MGYTPPIFNNNGLSGRRPVNPMIGKGWFFK
jgi:hypothetical protein